MVAMSPVDGWVALARRNYYAPGNRYPINGPNNFWCGVTVTPELINWLGIVLVLGNKFPGKAINGQNFFLEWRRGEGRSQTFRFQWS